jgi:hypothetical protein
MKPDGIQILQKPVGRTGIRSGFITNQPQSRKAASGTGTQISIIETNQPQSRKAASGAGTPVSIIDTDSRCASGIVLRGFHRGASSLLVYPSGFAALRAFTNRRRILLSCSRKLFEILRFQRTGVKPGSSQQVDACQSPMRHWASISGRASCFDMFFS